MKSGWYEEDDKFNRKLLIIMLKAKEPLQVTTAKLFSLSLATFIMVRTKYDIKNYLKINALTKTIFIFLMTIYEAILIHSIFDLLIIPNINNIVI